MISNSRPRFPKNGKILAIATVMLATSGVAFLHQFNLKEICQDLKFNWQIFQQEQAVNSSADENFNQSWLARYYFNNGDFDLALKYYRGTLSAVSELPGKAAKLTAISEAQLRIGQCLYKLGRYDEAAPELAKALAQVQRPAFIICQDTDTLRMLRNSRGNSHNSVARS